MKQSEKTRLSREKIIKAAITAFANNDYDEVSVTKFCREGNISKGKLYHHFASKEEVYYTCINDALVRLSEDMFAYEIKHDVDLSESFHDYYEGRINYWIKNPDDLLLIKSALDAFTSEQYSNIKENHLLIRKAMKVKTMEIIDTQKLSSKICVEDLYEVMQLVYERTFMHHIKKIILDLKSNKSESAAERKGQLLEMYDKLIYIMLYGILS